MRPTKAPERYSSSLCYLLLTDSGKLECYEKTLQVNTKDKWELAIDDEMESVMKSQKWNLVKLLEDKKALHNK